jgi:hypothetical protein
MARGDDVPAEELARFAHAVLAAIPAVRLAAEVLRGGPMARAAALELIDITLSDPPAAIASSLAAPP